RLRLRLWCRFGYAERLSALRLRLRRLRRAGERERDRERDLCRTARASVNPPAVADGAAAAGTRTVGPALSSSVKRRLTGAAAGAATDAATAPLPLGRGGGGSSSIVAAVGPCPLPATAARGANTTGWDATGAASGRGGSS